MTRTLLDLNVSSNEHAQETTLFAFTFHPCLMVEEQGFI